MKTCKSLFFSFLFISIATIGFAQTTAETIKVSGACGMCKTKIEKAAKGAGATYAEWDVESKMLSVKYNSATSNTAKIEQAVAKVGYDTKNVKAKDEDYNKLHSCCKYERATSSTDASPGCCADAKCAHADCMKEGKCTKEGKCSKDMSCCKEAVCDKNDCSKKDCCKKA